MPIAGAISNFPQGFSSGIAIRGMPLVQMQPGNVFWLSNNVIPITPQSSVGADNNRGTYLRPFATLQVAISQCLPGRGDTIFVGPGHAETISSATALNLYMSGVAVIGLGAGNLRPTFTLDTAATAVVSVTADNVSIQNCRFVANFANITRLFNLTNASVTASLASGVMTVTAVGSGTLYRGNTISGTGINANTQILAQLTGTTGGIGTYQVTGVQTVASGTVTTSAKNFALDNCDINDTSASLNFLNVLGTSTTANAMDGLSMTRNTITLKTAAGAATLFIPGAAADRVTIADNYYTALTTGTGAMIPKAAIVLTNFLLLRNTFNLVNAAATATGYLITTSSTTDTGYIDGNKDFCLANTTYLSSLAVTAGSGLRFGLNYHSRTADKSPGVVLPVADA